MSTAAPSGPGPHQHPPMDQSPPTAPSLPNPNAQAPVPDGGPQNVNQQSGSILSSPAFFNANNLQNKPPLHSFSRCRQGSNMLYICNLGPQNGQAQDIVPLMTSISGSQVEHISLATNSFNKKPLLDSELKAPGYAFVKLSSRFAVQQAAAKFKLGNSFCFPVNPQNDFKTPLIYNAQWSEHIAPDGTSYYYDCFNGESTWALPPVLGMLSHAAQDPNHASLKKVQLSPATLINPRNNSELGLNAQFRSLFVFGIPVTWSAITLENACLEALLLPPPGAAGSTSTTRRSNFQLASAVAPPTAFSTVARNAAAVGTSNSSADHHPAVATATPASTGKSGKAKAAKAKNKAKAKAKNKAANKASASASSQQQRGEYSASASQNNLQEQSKASSSTFRERSPKREQMLVSINAGSFSPTNKAFFMNLRNPNPATKKHLKVILQFDDNNTCHCGFGYVVCDTRQDSEKILERLHNRFEDGRFLVVERLKI
ncbi:unnamed protein product [Amoebophrya sp. A120]|nr:unnamed protein product [Amoebophrya sp. A120]|eukprot:GSA120T00014242001.1